MKASFPTTAAIPDSRLEPAFWRTAGNVLLLLMAGTILVMAVMAVDEPLRAMRSRSPYLLYIAGIVSRLGNHGYLLPVGLIVTVGLFRLHRARAARLVLILLLASLISGLCGTLIRSVVGRTRPEAPVEQGWFGPRKDGRWIVGRYAYSAFPSGHTSTAAGLGLILFGVGRSMGFAGLAYSLAIGWGRVMLGAHRPSDVIGGIIVGAITAMLLWPRVRGWIETGHSRHPSASSS